MKHKVKAWIRRYLLAEIIGTVSAVLVPTIILFFSDNTIIIALGGTWGENVGFYGTMVIREIMHNRKVYRERHMRYGRAAFARDIRNILIEFGFAESMDSLFIRPIAMYVSLTLVSNVQLGVLVGKLAADIVFYIPVVISYELRKKYLKG